MINTINVLRLVVDLPRQFNIQESDLDVFATKSSRIQLIGQLSGKLEASFKKTRNRHSGDEIRHSEMRPGFAMPRFPRQASVRRNRGLGSMRRGLVIRPMP